MKLVAFRGIDPLDSSERVGALIGDDEASETIVDLNRAYAAFLDSKEGDPKSQALADLRIPKSMIGLIEGGSHSLSACKDAINYAKDELGGSESRTSKSLRIVYKRDDVSLLAPIPFPRAIMDFQTFELHVQNFARKLNGRVPQEWYEMPGCYKKNPGSVIGHNGKVLPPNYTKELDYELELAIYVGEKAKNVKENAAYDYIFGFSIFNDFSARDIQLREMKINLGPFKGKDFDTSGAFGPCIVTSEEIGNPQELRMRSYLNGKQISEGNTKDMRWSIRKLIEYSSMEETLYPGYILGSGTVGFGSGYENDIRLRSGDVVELEIERIGKLRNEIA